MSQVAELIQHIKQKLRSAGLTYRDLADRIDVSESTLKRWFSQNSFNVERLDDICQALSIDLADVLPARRRRLTVQYLSEHQELELAANETLFLVFYLIVGGRGVADIVARYEVSAVKLRTYLIRLDQLELIELHPEDRIVPLVNQSIMWREGGLLEEKYGDQIRRDFLDTKFDGEHERRWFVSGRMSPASLSVFSRKLEALLKEFRDLIELDHDLGPRETVNVTFFAAHRPWALPLLKGKRRLS